MAEIFPAWEDEHTVLWGKQPIRAAHRLHLSPLFSMEGLADLIGRYPRQHYSLIHMGKQGSDRFWCEGDKGDLSGSEIMEAVVTGRFWLNLRCTNEVDPRYSQVLGQMFTEIGSHVPGMSEAPLPSLGILISSPDAQVYYHADLPNQSLWQVVGRKRVYVYPPSEPFLTPEDLERIAIYELEVDLPYLDWYDKYAAVFDLEPGQMLHWPLNSPHRVVNYDSINVSITTEYWSRHSQLRNRVNIANGALRCRFGMSPSGRSISGPAFLAKSVFVAGLSRTNWLKRVRKERRPIEFRLDPRGPGCIVDI